MNTKNVILMTLLSVSTAFAGNGDTGSAEVYKGWLDCQKIEQGSNNFKSSNFGTYEIVPNSCVNQHGEKEAPLTTFTKVQIQGHDEMTINISPLEYYNWGSESVLKQSAPNSLAIMMQAWGNSYILYKASIAPKDQWFVGRTSCEGLREGSSAEHVTFDVQTSRNSIVRNDSGRILGMDYGIQSRLTFDDNGGLSWEHKSYDSGEVSILGYTLTKRSSCQYRKISK